MKYHMCQRARHTKGRQYQYAKQDIGKIADGGIRQPSLNMRLFYSTAASVHDGEQHNRHKHLLRPGIPHKICSKTIIGQPDNGKGAGFHHCYRM